MSEAASQDLFSWSSSDRATSEGLLESPRSGNRFGVASAETGESSKRNSIAVGNGSESIFIHDRDQRLSAVKPDSFTRKPIQDSRGSHRSHRSKGSGSFLVSNSIFQPSRGAIGELTSPLEIPIKRRDDPQDIKRKAPAWSPENKHKRNRYDLGFESGESPLTTNTTSNGTSGDIGKKPQAAEDAAKDFATHPFKELNDDATQKNLDVESTQIVNLALNLSESRRNAARRNISTSLLPAVTGFGDGFASGSLRQHLQMQRRSSRNVSPKPERGGIVSPRIPSAQRIEISNQGIVGANRGADNKYQFSASTMARADKAKKVIELMAQYRRLLQYMPPLKPQPLTRVSNTPLGSHIKPAVALHANTFPTNVCNELGRPYNPLQYIRNRKVRARERKTIDGDSQGFGDVRKVASWVTQVSEDSTLVNYQTYDRVQLPKFNTGLDIVAPSSLPVQTTLGRKQDAISKHKRPRVDWITNPADMLADIYWLEEADHKKLVEDNRERKIFPKYVELSHSSSQKDGKVLIKQESETGLMNERLRIDTKLLDTTLKRTAVDDHLGGTRGRGPQKHHTSQFAETSHRISHGHQMSKSSNKSSSESSESQRRRRRPSFRRNATAGSNDLGTDILEKQMLEILAKESNGDDRVAQKNEDGRNVSKTFISSHVGPQESVSKVGHRGSSNSTTAPTSTSRDDFQGRKNSKARQAITTRTSLEVPDLGDRYSLDGLDSSPPESPIAKPSNSFEFVPNMVVETSPRSRRSSPTVHPTLAKVKSKISSLQDQSRNYSRPSSVRSTSRNPDEEKEKKRSTWEVPSTPNDSQRHRSPTYKGLYRKAEESIEASSKTGSLRRKAEELPAGIRGLFKTGRNPVQRLSDFIYRKENPTSSIASSDTSGEDIDLEEYNGTVASKTATLEKDSKRLGLDVSGELSPFVERKSYELPTFSSPFERRRDSVGQNEDTESPESDYISHHLRVRERQLSRFQLLQPPRIDVQSASPHSSLDIAPDRTGRDSDTSDLENRRRSSLSVKTADAKLNAILGMPGHSRAISGRDGFPVTGLTHVEDYSDDSMASKRQWRISDCSVSPSTAPIAKRDLARVRALLLSSGIKAAEITRRAAQIQDLRNVNKRENTYADVVTLNREPLLLKPVPRSEAHILAARILSHDIQLSSQIWQVSASNFSSLTVGRILDRVEELQDRILGRRGLGEMTRQSEREADEVSRDLIEGKTLAIKELLERMDKMFRKRRRRFRWIRRAGWVVVEWTLVGVMWWAWLIVVLIRFVMGTVGAVTRAIRWLLWL